MSEGDAREEFLAEAQEIIEGLSRDLLLLDQADKEGRDDPDLINEVFRGVHTLKGIAGMFGYHQLGAVTHALEDLLDDLRLGRVSLTQNVLDVLFEGVENFQRLLTEDPDGPPVDLEAYAAAIDLVQAPAPLARETLEDYARKIGRPANSLYNTLVRLRTALRHCIQARLRQEGGAA